MRTGVQMWVLQVWDLWRDREKEHLFLYMGIRKTLVCTRRTEHERQNKHVSFASHASQNVLGNLFITLPQFLHRTGHWIEAKITSGGASSFWLDTPGLAGRSSARAIAPGYVSIDTRDSLGGVVLLSWSCCTLLSVEHGATPAGRVDARSPRTVMSQSTALDIFDERARCSRHISRHLTRSRWDARVVNITWTGPPCSDLLRRMSPLVFMPGFRCAAKIELILLCSGTGEVCCMRCAWRALYKRVPVFNLTTSLLLETLGTKMFKKWIRTQIAHGYY